MAYATETELENYVGHAVDSDRATLLLDLASASIDDAADRDLTEAAATETLDGTGANELVLPRWPVTAVASVVDDGDTLTFDDDYRWSRAGVLERTGSCWTSKKRGVVVTYTAGYSTIPTGVKLVTLQAVGRVLVNPQGLRYAEGAGLPVELPLTKAEERQLKMALR